MLIKLSFMHILWAVSFSLALSMGSSDISHSYSHSNADALLNPAEWPYSSRPRSLLRGFTEQPTRSLRLLIALSCWSDSLINSSQCPVTDTQARLALRYHGLRSRDQNTDLYWILSDLPKRSQVPNCATSSLTAFKLSWKVFASWWKIPFFHN